jgi:hypothetical protein
VANLLSGVEPVVEAVVAEQATVYWNRPARRRVHHRGTEVTVSWCIEGVEVVAVTVGPEGPARIEVHDLNLRHPLRQRLKGARAVILTPER